MSYLTKRKFWGAALERLIKTGAQVSIATIGTTALFHEVDWVIVGSSTLLAMVLSVLTSIASGANDGQPSLAGEHIKE